MKIPNLKVNELENIDPETIVKYLEGNDWVEIEDRSTPYYSMWQHSMQNSRDAFILLPLDTEIPDFSFRVYDLIKVLSVVERRPLSSVFDSFKSAREVAEVEDRDILNLQLKFKDNTKREVLTGGLGKLLTSFQNLVNGIAQYKSGSPNSMGSIPNSIVQQSRMSVISTFEGSFGLRLASVPPQVEQLHAFQKPLIRETLQELFDLVRVSNDDKLLKESLIRLRKRSVSSYKQFLIALLDLKTDNIIDWGSPDRELGGSVEFSYEVVQKAFLIVTSTVAEIPDEIEILAEWVGGNKRKKNFEVKDTTTEQTYTGIVASTALKDIEVANISDHYNIRLLVEPEFNEATQEITKKFTLLRLEKPTS